MAATVLPCESQLSYTFTYTFQKPVSGTGKTEDAAKQDALKNIPAGTSDSAQTAARTDAEQKWDCATGCQLGIKPADVAYIATATPPLATATEWIAEIATAQVPVTINCNKPKLATTAIVSAGPVLTRPGSRVVLIDELAGRLAAGDEFLGAVPNMVVVRTRQG